jgi:hypothetical protein
MGAGPQGDASRWAAARAANGPETHRQAGIDVECQSASLAVASGATRCRVPPMSVGAGDRNRTGDVQLGNFLAAVSRIVTSCQNSSFCGYCPDTLVSPLVTPSHAIWAASWAASLGRRVNARNGQDQGLRRVRSRAMVTADAPPAPAVPVDAVIKGGRVPRAEPP